MRTVGVCIVVALCAVVHGISTAQDRGNSLAIFGTLTTSSKLFPHPNDIDENLRRQFFPLDDVLSGGIDYRRAIEALNVQIGASVEYLQKTDTFGSLETRDGFIAIPIELTGYFTVPVGSDRFHLYMGGGGGMYVGSRIFTYAGAHAVTIERHPGFGIHVVSGAEYVLTPSLSIRSDVKFRDVQFETVNQFQQTSVFSDNRYLSLDTQPFASRINIDGMTLNLGVVFHF